MTKYLLQFGVLLLLFFSSCQKNELLQQEPIQPLEQLSKKQINQLIVDHLQKTGDFDWNNLSDAQIVSAAKLSDDIIKVAWDFEATDDVDKNKIIAFVRASEDTSLPEDEVILGVKDHIKVLTVRATNPETIIGLRNLPEVELVEPQYAMFSDEELRPLVEKHFANSSNSLTDSKLPQGKSIKAYDEAVASYHGIKDAWANNIKGRAVKVGVVDNGVSRDDAVFGEEASSDMIHGPINTYKGRTLQKDGVFRLLNVWPFEFDGDYNQKYDVPPHFPHGNTMMSIIGRPLGDPSGAGIAFESNLHSIRSSTFVGISDRYKAEAIERAFNILTNSDAKIISMSMGWLTPWVEVNRAIKKAVKDNKKMVFLAAGTGPPEFITELLAELIFDLGPNFTLSPARHSDEPGWNTAYGVTGVTDWINTNNINYMTYCAWCYGQSDFVVQYPNFQGSSSESTASTAAMAALIWGDNPGIKDGSKIFDLMRRSSDYPNNKHANKGFGRVNMTKYLAIKGKVVALKGSNNRYVSSENGGKPIKCNRSGVGSWEKFKIINLANGKVALLGSNNRYVSSENGSWFGMTCKRSGIGSWEQFTMITLSDGKVAFRGNNGKYVSSENGSRSMQCNRRSIGSWEKFTITYP